VRAAPVFEKGPAGGQGGADQTGALVGETEHGVEPEGQEVPRGQQGGEVLLAVTEVVLEMVALGLEGVVVLVLDLPAGAGRGHPGGDVLLGDGPVGDEGVGVEVLALGVGDEELAPVHLQGVQESEFAQGVVEVVEHRMEGLGRDRVEHLTDLIVAGDGGEAEEAAGVVAAPDFLHRLLVREKGGRLGEEDREGAQTEVLQGVGEVLALAPIRPVVRPTTRHPAAR
jgi:hypothetical protein